MLMQRARQGRSASRAWARLRVQLGGALVLAVVLPLLGAVWLWPEIATQSYDHSIVGMMMAVSLSVYLLRNFTLFPGVKTGYFVLPSVLFGYVTVFSLMLFLRLDYSRAVLSASMIACLSWLYLTHLMATRNRQQRIAIIPFGEVASLQKIRGISWVRLSTPNYDSRRYEALVVDFRHDLPDAWEAFLADCALRGLPVFHVKQLSESLTGRVEIEHLSENNLGSLIPFMAYLRLRGLLDFLGAAVIGLLLLPLFAIVAIAIKLESDGPVLFRQRRIGYRGEPFMVAKFRTMQINRSDEEERMGAITQDNDTRITKVGRLLRRTRIDELPQILNILKGEMSWIGPRPEAEVLSRWYERELPFYRYRHIVPPGITGWAQVNQGHVAELEDVNFKLQYDFYYIKNFSPWLDALIVARTVLTVFTGFGSR